MPRKPERNEGVELSLLLSIVEVLLARGVKQAAAVGIGMEAVKLFCRRFGGGTVYLPKLLLTEVAEKTARIYREFDGSNYAQLAVKYELTEQRIRQLLKRSGKAKDRPKGPKKPTREEITARLLRGE
jgi:Mor family transcriptional regulator